MLIVSCYLDRIINMEICQFKYLDVTVEHHTSCTLVPLLMNTCIADCPHILMIIHWEYYYFIYFSAQELNETHVNLYKQIYWYLQILLLTPWSRGSSWEANIFYLIKKFPLILWHLKGQYHVYRSTALVFVLSQISPVHALHLQLL
jgi:hypothetical protein